MIDFSKYFNGKKGFIPFVTCGDPSIDDTYNFVIELIKAGSTLIELGIPFSDPTAEGKTIEKADVRALSAGCTTDKIFDMIKKIRVDYPDFPLLFMTYCNPVHTYGYERFFKKCHELNMVGIIIPDLPFEEKGEISEYCKKYNIANISLIAPTSKERIKMIASEAEGFVYLVSSLGVTGMRNKITTDVDAIAKEIKKYTNIPVCVGFGIKSKESAKAMVNVSDGAIIGSAIVNIIEEHKENSAKYVYEFASSIVEAINN